METDTNWIDTAITQGRRVVQKVVTLGSTFLAAVLLVALLAVPIKLFLGRYSSSSDNHAYVILSRRDRGLDEQLEEFSLQNPQLSYMRMGSQFADHVISGLDPKLSRADLLLVRSDNSAWATADPQAINERLKTIQKPNDDKLMMPWSLIGGLGLCLGIFGRSLVRKRVAFILSVASLAAFWKLTHTCPTCSTTALLGVVDASLAGTVLYLAMALYAAARPEPALQASSLFCGAVSLWQVMAIIEDPNPCQPCMLILFCNAVVAGLALGGAGSPVESPVARAFSVRRLGVMMSAIVLFGSLSAIHARSQAGPGANTGPKGHQGHVQLVGMKLADLGVAAKDIPSSPCLVMFGMANCTPCESARTRLSGQVDIPLRVIELVRPGNTPKWGSSSAPDSAYFPNTPGFVVVSGRGVVVSQSFGWSNDREWYAAFRALVLQDLAHASAKEKGK